MSVPTQPEPIKNEAAGGIQWQRPARKNGFWKVTRTEPHYTDMLNPERAADRRRVAKEMNVSEDKLLESHRQAVQAAEASSAVSAQPFKTILRGRLQPKAEGRVFEEATTREALERVFGATGLPDEAVIEWEDRRQACVADLDCHDELQSQRLRDHEPVLQFFPPHLPQPLAAWRSHRGGLKAIFVAKDGFDADALAGVWYASAPLGRLAAWPVEIATRTRHPAGLRDGQPAGPVELFEPSATFQVPNHDGLQDAEVSEEEVEAWLAERELEIGHRYSHASCPFNPDGKLENPGVAVEADGILCFRCGRFASWARLVGGDETENSISLYAAARSFVHLHHQKFVIKELRPKMPDDLIAPAWRAMLLRTHAGADEATIARAEAAASVKGPDLVRSTAGLWLDAKVLESRSCTKLTAAALPWTGGDGVKMDAALDTHLLEGFVPIRAINADQVIGPFTTTSEEEFKNAADHSPPATPTGSPAAGQPGG